LTPPPGVNASCDLSNPSLDIEIWSFIGIWCLEFEISDFRTLESRTLNVETGTWNRCVRGIVFLPTPATADRKCIDNRQAFFYKYGFEKFSTGRSVGAS
jgi:hypothetical protein